MGKERWTGTQQAVPNQNCLTGIHYPGMLWRPEAEQAIYMKDLKSFPARCVGRILWGQTLPYHRRGMVCIRSGVTRDRAIPAVFVFHSAGEAGDEIADHYRLEPAVINMAS